MVWQCRAALWVGWRIQEIPGLTIHCHSFGGSSWRTITHIIEDCSAQPHASSGRRRRQCHGVGEGTHAACVARRCQIEEGWTEGLTRLQSDMDWAVHIFTVKYTCGGCGGTMVPLGVCGSEGVQCNVCGVRRGKDDWQEDLQGQDGE